MIKSYCKVNLSLRIIKKLKNKMHSIQSNVFLINVHDNIYIKKIKKNKDRIIFKGKFKKFIKKKNNSIKKTLYLLRRKKLINKSNHYLITIEKKIPVFSGLGGGTSNSAYLLKYFIKKKIGETVLKAFEKKIGSDLRLFFHKQSFQKNLKKVSSYNKNFKINFLIIYPNIKCSTREIYSKVNNYSKSSKVDYSKINTKKKLIEIIKKEKNDLQKISISKFPIIGEIINFTSNLNGCLLSRMSGSGSACFGIFQSKKSAIIGLKAIKKKFPDFWCVIAKTI